MKQIGSDETKNLCLNIKEDIMIKCQEYKKGFFKFETKDMGTEKFKEFWKRINGENNNFQNYVNERFLGEIAAKYAVAPFTSNVITL